MIQGPGSCVTNYFNEDHIADVAKLNFSGPWENIHNIAIATLNNIT